MKRRRRRALWNEIRRVAHDDLDALAEQLAAREESADDAYYEAVGLHQRAAERLATARTLEEIRAVGRLAARARGALLGAADRAGCFFRPAPRRAVRCGRSRRVTRAPRRSTPAGCRRCDG